MTHYGVEAVSLDQPETRRKVSQVVRDAFGSDVGDERIFVNTHTKASAPSLYLAAVEGGEIIGFNAFISHDFRLNGQQVNAYQSCWTATSPQHRGKKIFQNILLAAHDILRRRGAAFVFGFPNDASYPLFTKKLGYQEQPSLKWQMPAFRPAHPLWLKSRPERAQVSRIDAVGQNDRQLIELKCQEYGGNIVVADVKGSLAWAVRRTRTSRGLSVPYLDVGGIELASSDHIGPLLTQLRRKAGPVAYLQFVTVQSNRLNEAFRHVRPAQTNVLIWFDLNLDTKGLAFNFFGGVRDVF